MRAACLAMMCLVGCVPAGTDQHGEMVFLEGGDEAPPPRETAPAEEEPTVTTPSEEPPGAADLFEAVEARLLEAEPLQIDFDVTAEGAVAASVAGRARFVEEGHMTFEARGTFAGEPLDAKLEADGERLRGADGAVDQPVPTALKEAMVLGFMRMGILHNVAKLAGGEAPDHADGDVHPWVTVDGHSLGEPEELGGRRTWPLSFDISVGGEPAGEATLWIDAETGLPVQRGQVVRFAEGEMRVTERYARIVADTR